MSTTSPEHPAPRQLRQVILPGTGVLWLSAMPGRQGGWPAFLDDAQRARLDLVMCLTPRHEIARQSPEYLAAIDNATLPFTWRHMPMLDFGLSAQLDDYVREVDHVAERLDAGASVMLHCAAGIGRTGTTAACVLMRLGLPAAEALRRVRAAGSNPESALQAELVERFAPGRRRG